MKKKIITIMLAAAMLVSMLASCGTTNGGTSPASDISSSAEVSSDSPSSENTADIDISDDILSGQFAIDGHVYTLPCAFSEFVENGWEYTFEDSATEPDFFVPSQSITKGDMTIYISLFNNTSETIHYTDCVVVGIDADTYESGAIVLPGNFVFDEDTTQDDIIAQYGDPTEIYDTDNYTVLRYEKNTSSWVYFQMFKPGSGLDSSYNHLSMEFTL